MLQGYLPSMHILFPSCLTRPPQDTLPQLPCLGAPSTHSLRETLGMEDGADPRR